MLQHAEGSPRRLAVTDDRLSLSYEELRQRVEATAAGLRSAGVAEGSRVALWLGNTADFVVCALACMWAGAIFVPLPADDPAARLAYMLDDSDPAIVVVDGTSSTALAERAFGDRRAVTVEQMARTSTSPGAPATDLGRDVYIVYTSGTTGLPKGACIPGTALARAVATAASALAMSASSRTLCVSPFHFDGSYGNVFPTLLAGGALFIPPRRELLFLRRFFTSIDTEAITHTGFSPSYLRLLLASRQLRRLEASTLTIALGGEECLAADIARLWEVAPTIKLFNRYGPTESTIAVTYHEVTPLDLKQDRVPIGRPTPGAHFWLVTEDGRLIETPGTVGELYIGGAQLMSRYWKDPSRTSQVLGHGPAPELTYRTGDLAYRDGSGLYYYVGRTDDVIKRNGVRVSLDEVALAFRQLEGVTGAVCLRVGTGPSYRTVVFVQAPPGTLGLDLQKGAADHLSEAMRPDTVIVVDSLPTTSSGKVDRQALLAGHFPEASGLL